MSKSSQQQVNDLLHRLDTPKGRQIIMILTGLVVVYFGMTQVKPGYEKIDTIKQQQQAALKGNQTLKQQYQTLLPQTQNTQLLQVGKELGRALPIQLLADDQYALIQKLATATGVKLSQFTPGTPSGGTSYQDASISLPVEGSLVNCLRFLGGLQNMTQVGKDGIKSVGPLWHTDSVTLSSSAAASGGGSSMTMSISGGLYQSGTEKKNPSAGNTTQGAAG